MPPNREAVFSQAACRGRATGTQLLTLAVLAENFGMRDDATVLVERAYKLFDIAGRRVCEDTV
jgi:hypothetical protein